MEDIKPVVSRIVAKCGRDDVSETLAAFVARMVVYENPERFRLDTALTEETVEDLVQLSVRFLQQKDSPSLETVRMQVAFDTSYYDNHMALETSRQKKDKRLQDIQVAITSVSSKSSGDFEAMTALYRQIFAYLTVHSDAEATSEGAVQREIAAALESVFPRVGLKSFVALSQSEKTAQLQELARLILGIRLFNAEVGKGGEGIEDEPGLSRSEASALMSTISSALEDVREVCQQYSDVLVFAHLGHDAPREGVAGRTWEDTKSRWRDELTNRRQFAAYLKSLASEVNMSEDAIKMSSDALAHELEDLKRMVGARTSVPKEQVYPKFSALAGLWISLKEHRQRVESRQKVMMSLEKYRESHVRTLSIEWVQRARKARAEARAVRVPDARAEAKDSGAGDGPAAAAGVDGPAPSAGGGAGAEGSAGASGKAPEAKDADDADGKGDEEGKAGGEGKDGDDKPVRLSLESTPEFMQLPLEYQGYCPWTIVHRNGLLLPGDPSLGVVRYRGTFSVFTSEAALEAYMAAPSKYIDGVVLTARRNPELVHLLQLQVHFPEAALPNLLRGSSTIGDSSAGPSDGPAVMRDAATETPTHFVEKHIDPRYEWNEWALRRKALQLANLKNAVTVSSQTNNSHFRRENESQVYLPKDKSSNTGVSKGTNPPRVHRYIAGMRGGGTVTRATDVLKDEKAKRDPGRSMGRAAAKQAPTKASVVELKFDL